MKNIVCSTDYMENLQRNDRRQVLHYIYQGKLPINTLRTGDADLRF